MDEKPIKSLDRLASMLPGIRKRLGFFSRRGLADALGVSEQTVTSWESGRRPIPRWLPLALGFLRSHKAILANIADCVVASVDIDKVLNHALSMGLPLPELYSILDSIGRGGLPNGYSREDIQPIESNPLSYHRLAMQDLIYSQPELFFGLTTWDMFDVEEIAHQKLAELLAQRLKAKMEGKDRGQREI